MAEAEKERKLSAAKKGGAAAAAAAIDSKIFSELEGVDKAVSAACSSVIGFLVQYNVRDFRFAFYDRMLWPCILL